MRGKNLSSGVFCFTPTGCRTSHYPPEREKGLPGCFISCWATAGLFLKSGLSATLSNRCYLPQEKTLEKEIQVTKHLYCLAQQLLFPRHLGV